MVNGSPRDRRLALGAGYSRQASGSAQRGSSRGRPRGKSSYSSRGRSKYGRGGRGGRGRGRRGRKSSWKQSKSAPVPQVRYDDDGLPVYDGSDGLELVPSTSLLSSLSFIDIAGGSGTHIDPLVARDAFVLSTGLEPYVGQKFSRKLLMCAGLSNYKRRSEHPLRAQGAKEAVINGVPSLSSLVVESVTSNPTRFTHLRGVLPWHIAENQILSNYTQSKGAVTPMHPLLLAMMLAYPKYRTKYLSKLELNNDKTYNSLSGGQNNQSWLMSLHALLELPVLEDVYDDEEDDSDDENKALEDYDDADKFEFPVPPSTSSSLPKQMFKSISASCFLRYVSFENCQLLTPILLLQFVPASMGLEYLDLSHTRLNVASVTNYISTLRNLFITTKSKEQQGLPLSYLNLSQCLGESDKTLLAHGASSVSDFIDKFFDPRDTELKPATIEANLKLANELIRTGIRVIQLDGYEVLAATLHIRSRQAQCNARGETEFKLNDTCEAFTKSLTSKNSTIKTHKSNGAFKIKDVWWDEFGSKLPFQPAWMPIENCIPLMGRRGKYFMITVDYLVNEFKFDVRFVETLKKIGAINKAAMDISDMMRMGRHAVLAVPTITNWIANISAKAGTESLDRDSTSRYLPLQVDQDYGWFTSYGVLLSKIRQRENGPNDEDELPRSGIFPCDVEFNSKYMNKSKLLKLGLSRLFTELLKLHRIQEYPHLLGLCVASSVFDAEINDRSKPYVPIVKYGRETRQNTESTDLNLDHKSLLVAIKELSQANRDGLHLSEGASKEGNLATDLFEAGIVSIIRALCDLYCYDETITLINVAHTPSDSRFPSSHPVLGNSLFTCHDNSGSTLKDRENLSYMDIEESPRTVDNKKETQVPFKLGAKPRTGQILTLKQSKGAMNSRNVKPKPVPMMPILPMSQPTYSSMNKTAIIKDHNATPTGPRSLSQLLAKQKDIASSQTNAPCNIILTPTVVKSDKPSLSALMNMKHAVGIKLGKSNSLPRVTNTPKMQHQSQSSQELQVHTPPNRLNDKEIPLATTNTASKRKLIALKSTKSGPSPTASKESRQSTLDSMFKK